MTFQAPPLIIYHNFSRRARFQFQGKKNNSRLVNVIIIDLIIARLKLRLPKEVSLLEFPLSKSPSPSCCAVSIPQPIPCRLSVFHQIHSSFRSFMGFHLGLVPPCDPNPISPTDCSPLLGFPPATPLPPSLVVASHPKNFPLQLVFDAHHPSCPPPDGVSRLVQAMSIW